MPRTESNFFADNSQNRKFYYRNGLPGRISFPDRHSDVDLLFAPRGWGAVEELLAALGGLDGFGSADGPRLDGEILLPDGGAVAWRELASRPSKLLVKGPMDVTLRDRAAVAALFSEE